MAVAHGRIGIKMIQLGAVDVTHLHQAVRRDIAMKEGVEVKKDRVGGNDRNRTDRQRSDQAERAINDMMMTEERITTKASDHQVCLCYCAP